MKKIFIACTILLIVGLTGVYFFFDFIQRETTKNQQKQLKIEMQQEESQFKTENSDLLRIILTPVSPSGLEAKKEQLQSKVSPELIDELFPEDFETIEDSMSEIAQVFEVTTIRLKDVGKISRQTTSTAKILTKDGKEQEVSVVAKYKKEKNRWVMRGITPVANSGLDSEQESSTEHNTESSSE